VKKLSLPLRLLSGFLYLFLYAPIAVVALYSFNARRYGMVWSGFTTQWYGQLLKSSEKVMAAVKAKAQGRADMGAVSARIKQKLSG